VPPPPAPPSRTSQPNPTTNPTPDSRELSNTLERLRAQQRQTQPPSARPNPQAARAPTTGGSRAGDITASLSAQQQGAIGDRVRECWTKDAGALDLEKMTVQLVVTYDETGTVRLAEVGDADRGRFQSDPRFRAFTERAIRAVRDPRCASLPIPRSEMGKVGSLTFRFRP
jgi:hypothetical protein